MSERIQVIHCGSRPVCEVLEPEDDISIVIRYAGNHEEKLTLPKLIVPTLAEVLSDINPALEHQPKSHPGGSPPRKDRTAKGLSPTPTNLPGSSSADRSEKAQAAIANLL